MARKKAKADVSFSDAAARFLRDVLRPDLRQRAEDPAVRVALRELWEEQRRAHRTSDREDAFVEYTVEQVGASWILSTLFRRVLEERGFVAERRVAGEGAEDDEALFREQFPHLGPCEYLLSSFNEVGTWPEGTRILSPAVSDAWKIAPSQEVARGLLDLFRDADSRGEPRWRFEGTDTRFLGDLYERLSEGVRERFALLQTPKFVEEFILDETLEPALREFGLEGLNVIDPTCGSGHFLLGAFARLLEAERREHPALDPKTVARRALAHVHGVDINPYAVAIARLRLALAFAEASGVRQLAPDGAEEGSEYGALAEQVVVADSLAFDAAQGQGELATLAHDADAQRAWGVAGLSFESPGAVRKVLTKRFHAVVGNPPYISVKDPTLRDAYRARYPDSAKGKYTLSAPFTERFFQLANAEGGGFVGLINSNAFMKREFGKGLIERVLSRLDLSLVVDTSCAYIPGHGTPTVIIFGRNRRPFGDSVQVVMGRRGEASLPEDPAKGAVWASAVCHAHIVGYEDDYVTVGRVSLATLARHPWSLGGGGAGDLKELIDAWGEKRLEDYAESVGVSCVTGEDDLYVLPRGAAERARIEHRRYLVTGDILRDWSVGECDTCIFPYGDGLKLLTLASMPAEARHLWPARSIIRLRRRFGVPMIQRGAAWYELQELYREKLATPLSITYPEVATHNHFALDRGGKVFKNTAPVIKLPASASEDEHLSLLAWLNSSSACFWMKQVAQRKANQTEDRPERMEAEMNRFQFSATVVGAMPVPRRAVLGALLHHGREMEGIGNREAPFTAERVADRIRTSDASASRVIEEAERAHDLHRRQRIAVQENLDWYAYARVGLCDEEAGQPIEFPDGLAAEARLFVCATPPAGLSTEGIATWERRRAALAESRKGLAENNFVNFDGAAGSCSPTWEATGACEGARRGVVQRSV